MPKQTAVVRERRWYQSHCNVCGRDVGNMYRLREEAQLDADIHNAATHEAYLATTEEEAE